MELTTRQMEYLYFLKKHKGSKRTVTNIAKVFQLSKPTVSNMLDILDEKDLIKRKNGIILTPLGNEIADRIVERHEIISSYFVNELGVHPKNAEQDAIKYIGEMSEEGIEALISHAHMIRAINMLRGDFQCSHMDSFEGILPDGTYRVPFTVFQRNCSKISMGDRGFKKPALLTINQGRGVVTLTSQTIQYRSKIGLALSGTLDRLNYWDGSDYVPARAEGCRHTFPLMDIRFANRNPDGGLSGFVRIQAAATVGIVNMPISEADLELVFVHKADL